MTGDGETGTCPPEMIKVRPSIFISEDRADTANGCCRLVSSNEIDYAIIGLVQWSVVDGPTSSTEVCTEVNRPPASYHVCPAVLFPDRMGTLHFLESRIELSCGLKCDWERPKVRKKGKLE